MNILDELTEYARIRVQEAEKRKPLTEVRREAEALAAEERAQAFRFEQALARPEMSFICEVKKASPSKGLIAPDFPYLQIAEEYESAGAAAISCLTEPKWFLGRDAYLQEIASKVQIPVLRKDFTVDPYMIYEAKTLGASAVLLICAVLPEGELREYISIADSLGLSSLVEAHTAAEAEEAVRAGARVIGVNNRNLKDFSVDAGNCMALRRCIPDDAVFVAESGIRTAEDVRMLSDGGADAVLIGETLMRSPDKKQKLDELRSRL